jgi:hypothetical protein
MNIARNPENVAASITVLERSLLFCVAGGTDWQNALGVTDATVTAIVVKGLVEGHAVLAALSKAD